MKQESHLLPCSSYSPTLQTRNNLFMWKVKSEELSLDVGIPQDSVLGPLLFIVYILPRHGYPDDTQSC